MKRNILFALLFALMAGSALAQQAGPGTGPADGTGPGPGDGSGLAPADGTGFGAGMGPGAGAGNFQGGPGFGPGAYGDCQNPDGGAQLAEQLGLEGDTATEFMAIMEAARLEHLAIRETIRTEYCAVRTEVEDAMAEILNEDQFEAWLATRNQMERHRGFRGQFGPFDPAYDCGTGPAAE
jgi:hypothetical protein